MSEQDVLDIHDSEIVEIEKVLKILNERSTGHRDLEAFNREIKERFAEIGFVVQTKWWETDVADCYRPDIEIVGRTEQKDFDHDRQVHEVVNDVLGLGEGGVISTKKLDPEQWQQGHDHKH